MARLKPLWLSVGWIAERLHQAPMLRVGCDYDGTLTPIAERPDEAALPDRARQAIARLAELPDAAVGVFSGRSLADLESRVNLPTVFLSGVAGLEDRPPGGERRVHIDPDGGLPAPLLLDLEAWCRRFPGAAIEDKRLAIAFHYRAVAPTLQPAFRAGLRRRIRPYRERVQLVHGKRVFDVLPRTTASKAAALERWLGGAPRGAFLYFGDDTHDEPVHEWVREVGGVAVAVGRRASRAEFALGSPREVIWFLEWLGREWEARHDSPAERQRLTNGGQAEPALPDVAAGG